MKHLLLGIFSMASLSLALALPAVAQAQTTPKLSHQDTEFLKDAAEAGNAEVAGSKLAVVQSANADVKAFAQTMIDDHDKAASELKSLAEQKGVKVSDTPSAAKRMQIKLLSGRKGAGFDQHYAESIGVDAHQDAVKLFQKEVDKGTDADVKAWASKTLPTLTHHLEMAQNLKAATATEPKK